MKKVLIIGCPGSGKSTFGRALHEVTGLPLFHLDLLFWNPDKTTVDESVFLERLSEVIQKEEWILDGDYRSTMEWRLQNCDTVFFLDYPLEQCLAGIEERRGKTRPDLPWLEPDDENDPEFMELIHGYSSQRRPHVLELLRRYADKEIYIFPNRDRAELFLKELQG